MPFSYYPAITFGIKITESKQQQQKRGSVLNNEYAKRFINHDVNHPSQKIATFTPKSKQKKQQ